MSAAPVLFTICHETRFEYEEPVSYSIRALKLTPRPDPQQHVLGWRVQTTGERIEQTDPFGNLTHFVTLESPHRETRIVAEGTIELTEAADLVPQEPGRLTPFAYLAATALTQADPAVRSLAERHLGRHPPSPRSLMDLAAGIRDAVVCEPGMTDHPLGAAEALDLGAGTAQDHAHVLIACCRASAIPARYVHGYRHGVSGETVNHAWAEVWLGAERGWLSLDVTHPAPTEMQHCRLAVGRDYLDAAPVRSARRGGGLETVTVKIQAMTGQVQQP